MTLEELKEAEDDFDETDRKAIEKYRYSKIILPRLTVHVSLLYMYVLLKNKLRIFCAVMSADWHNCLFSPSAPLPADRQHSHYCPTSS